MASSATASASSPMATGGHSYTKSPLAMGIILFMVVFSFVWVLLYAFKPSFCCVTGDDGKPMTHPHQADSTKCVFGALIIALIILVVVWMFKALK